MRWRPALPLSDYLVVNNKTITFHSGGGNTGSIADQRSVDRYFDRHHCDADHRNRPGDRRFDAPSAGSIDLTTGTTADISFTGSAAGTLTKLGLTGHDQPQHRGAGPAADHWRDLAVRHGDHRAATRWRPAFAAGDTITVNGQNLTFLASGASGNNQINIGDNVTHLLSQDRRSVRLVAGLDDHRRRRSRCTPAPRAI